MAVQGNIDFSAGQSVRGKYISARGELTDALWCSVNERDGLGDNLVPDYLTHVTAAAFYDWHWWNNPVRAGYDQ
jgi:hypothetical protein